MYTSRIDFSWLQNNHHGMPFWPHHPILSIFFPCVDFRAIEKLPIVIGVIGNLLPSPSSLAPYEPPAGLPTVDRLSKPAPRHKSPCGMDALQECDETSPESPLRSITPARNHETTWITFNVYKPIKDLQWPQNSSKCHSELPDHNSPR